MAQTSYNDLILPGVTADQQKLDRQYALAKALREQSLAQEANPTQVIGGYAVKQSPWEHLAKVASKLGSAYFAKNIEDDSDAKRIKLAQDYGKATGSMLTGEPTPQALAQAAALKQGAANMPSGGTMATATEGPANPPIAPPIAPIQSPMQTQNGGFGPPNMPGSQRKLAFALDPSAYVGATMDQYKDPEAIKTWRAQGIDPLTMAASTRAAAVKAGMHEAAPGSTVTNLATGQRETMPILGTGMQMVNGQAQAIPGFAGANAGIKGAEEGVKYGQVTTPTGATVPMQNSTAAGLALSGKIGQSTQSKTSSEAAGKSVIQTMETGFQNAQNAAQSLDGVYRAIDLIDKGVFSGTLSDWKQIGARAFGLDPERVANTAELRAIAANQFLEIGSTQKGTLSETDAKRLERASVDPSSLSDGELKAIANRIKSKLNTTIEQHNDFIVKRVNPDLYKGYGADLRVTAPENKYSKPDSNAGWGIQRVK